MDLAHQKEEEEDQSNGQGGGDDEEVQEEGEATPPKDPPIEAETSKKRKVSPQKPLARKMTCSTKPKMKAMLTEDDVDLIITTIKDSLEYILQ
jgi:cell division protein FtsN